MRNKILSRCDAIKSFPLAYCTAKTSLISSCIEVNKKEMALLFSMLLAIITCTSNILCADNSHVHQFAIEFFERKFIRQMTVFACSNIHDQINFYRQSMAHNFKLSYIPISSGILDMRRALTVNYYDLGIVIDLDCPRSEVVLEEFSRQQLSFNQTYHWLLLTELEIRQIPILRDLPLTIDTEMTVAVENNKLSYTCYDVYNPSYRHGGSLIITPMGKWNRDNGLHIELTQYKYHRRQDLGGLRLNFSIVTTNFVENTDDPSAPDFETYINNPVNRHFDTMHRYHYTLLKHLRDHYNFSINLMRSDSWGYLVNGSFNGMMGMLQQGIVDIGATPLIPMVERLEASEFTVQTYVARAALIFRHPKMNTVRNGFTRPFTEQVWWLTLIVAVLNWLLLWLTARFEIRLKNNPSTCTLSTHPASETALITVAALCQQGLSDGPKLCSGRIVFLSLFLWALLLFQYYSASIVGSLLAEPPRYINTLKDLLESDIAVGIEDIAYNHNFFATSTDPVALELYKRKIAPGKRRKKAAFFSVSEGLRRVQKGSFAFQADTNTAYKIITDTFTEDEICDLAEILLWPVHRLVTVTSKHSPFKKMVTYGMRQIIERGMSERQAHVWQYRRPTCPASHSSKPVQVPLEEFAPVLLLLMIGTVSAASILLVEYCVKRRSLNSYLMKNYATDDEK